ncbi:trimethylamine N-oxide reductase system protein TorE [Photobacterium lucens]|uniref:trimethylamine N-oxide reductase system protein TorE n=1 Tax=Photobacterium lucens TaxID=2562949 RepID=UPI001369F8E6|nr:trimethylamine N-oxide reductase system protein TorE [Photobacterium lucens]MBP2701761.1 trimethylamine N-oxide reductase system protein TorE [Vibrio parahaemolyticus]MZG55037.1 trimethylamine N-oxide reductase system protein TorE [Photobacterium lucens]MZG81867.1 trimethylamine N-oxide reductase system protein TorE [Photobacterium lucens]
MYSDEIDDKDKGRYEWRTFLFIVVLLFPILSVMFVSGYGFIVWALQVFVFGPPGHG